MYKLGIDRSLGVMMLKVTIAFFFVVGCVGVLESGTFADVKELSSEKILERKVLTEALKSNEFDILIIGGGATGVGAALDAANRGLRVALFERGDFASGTSSKSTKLVHGGVRYLEKAVRHLDKQQYHLVLEALHERGNLFQMAPHLVKALEIVTPLYRLWEIPYYWIGLKLYDWIARAGSLHKSEFVPPQAVVSKIPSINKKGLVGGVSYYDGQFNDTRLNITLVLSARSLGAVPLNYVEVVGFLKEEDSGRLQGVVAKDLISGEVFEVHSASIINAAGPYVDAIRKMDNPEVVPIISASSGTHLILNKELLPSEAGVLIPKTKDGRVLFILPWEGKTLVGTTDDKATLSDHPQPSEQDIDYLLGYVKDQLNITLTRSDVLSAWTGLRPLVRSPNAKETANIVRDHYIEKSSSGLVTITGGKWTTFRRMAEDVINQVAGPTTTSTAKLRLIGAGGYSASLSKELGIQKDIADHLVSSYGGLAKELLSYNHNERIIEGYPYIVSEIHWAIDRELAQKPLDILARRTRLATLDVKAAKKALPQVIALMQEKLNWTSLQAEQETENALAELASYSPVGV